MLSRYLEMILVGKCFPFSKGSSLMLFQYVRAVSKCGSTTSFRQMTVIVLICHLRIVK